MRERAISSTPDFAVARDGLAERRLASGGEGDRPDLTIDIDVEDFLEEARRRGDAVIDGRVEVHERERRTQRGAVGGLPVASHVDVSNERVGDRLQSRFQRGEVFRGDVDPAFAREDGEGDALVGRAAGIVRVIGPTALHVEHMAERGLEVRIDFLGSAVDGRCAIGEHQIAVERGDSNGVRLVAAKQIHVSIGGADEKADVAERGIAAAAENSDGADRRCRARDAPLLVRSRHQRARAGDAGAFETGADKGRAPRCLVGLIGMSEFIEHRDDARIVHRARTLGLAKLAPSLGHPRRLLHRMSPLRAWGRRRGQTVAVAGLPRPWLALSW